MKAFYNEIEPYAAEWMENLATKGHIAASKPDESVKEHRLVRRMDTAEARAFWAFVDRTAAEVRKWPCWMRGCSCGRKKCRERRGGR